jgi:hypothetical protein
MSFEEIHQIYEILDQVYKKRQALINADCFGCVHNCPSQKDHPCLDLTRAELRELSRRAFDELQLEITDYVYAQVLSRIEEERAVGFDEVDELEGM